MTGGGGSFGHFSLSLGAERIISRRQWEGGGKGAVCMGQGEGENTDYSLRVTILLEVQFDDAGDNDDPLLKASKKLVVMFAIRSVT